MKKTKAIEEVIHDFVELHAPLGYKDPLGWSRVSNDPLNPKRLLLCWLHEQYDFSTTIELWMSQSDSKPSVMLHIEGCYDVAPEDLLDYLSQLQTITNFAVRLKAFIRSL